MIIFDGYQFAQEREALLAQRVRVLSEQGIKIVIAAVLFEEDKGSQLYTGLKQQAAERVGMEYRISSFSIVTAVDQVLAEIERLNQDPEVTGIIIQKPWRKTWERAMGYTESAAAEYQAWWSHLVKAITPLKDVDGLHPQTLEAIQDGSWQEKKKVMPATAKAVLSILESSNLLHQAKYLVIGKSEILGLPLAYELKNQGFEVEVMGKKDLDARMNDHRQLKDGDVVISATGQHNLITGQMIKNGAALIDVGEPRPDVDRHSVEGIAAFLTPVPGGVGPVTVVSLLENALHLANNS